MASPRRTSLIVAAWVLAAIVLGAAVQPSAAGWHVADDLTNMRWVLDHRDAPWRALTGRHSVHDHIRPLTLVATWAGAQLSDGAFWGVWLANVGLLAAGVAGIGALAARLARAPLAGPVAALLVAALGGTLNLGWWNAWLCSAGELAAGAWALWAAVGAFDRDRPPVLAWVLLVAAGLFKEPGWLFAGPVVLLALSRRRVVDAGVTAAIAAAGVVFTWHPANLLRSESVVGTLPERVDAFLVDATTTIGPLGPARLVLLGALFAGLVLSRSRTVGGVALAACAAVAGGAAALGGDPVGWGLGTLAVAAVVAAGTSRAAPGLWLLLATWLPVATYPGTNTVQRLSGAAGVVVAGVVAAFGWRPALRTTAALAAAGVAVATVAVQPAPPEAIASVGTARERQELFLGLGAVAAGTNAATVARVPAAARTRDDILDGELLRLAPLVGLVQGEAPRPGVIQVEAALLLGDPGNLVAVDQVGGAELPVVRSERDRPRPGQAAREETRSDLPAVSFDLPAGWYAVGVLQQGRPDAAVEAEDACGRRWAPRDPVDLAVMTAVPVHLEAGCGPLRLRRTAYAGTEGGRVVLARLPDPPLSLRAAPVHGPVLDVSIRSGDLDLPVRGGGPRAPER